MALDLKNWPSLPFELRAAIKDARREEWQVGRVRCEDCNKKLDYEYGSIKWACIENDICFGCFGNKAIDKFMTSFRKSYTEALKRRSHPRLERDDREDARGADAP